MDDDLDFVALEDGIVSWHDFLHFFFPCWFLEVPELQMFP